MGVTRTVAGQNADTGADIRAAVDPFDFAVLETD